jgi:hypothetical protein
LAFPGRAYPELAELAVACWEILDAAGGGPGVCPLMIHCIASALLVELFGKVPPRCFENMDRSFPFPGHCHPQLENFAVSIEVGDDAWYSTGLYLVPGTIATVTIARPAANCWIQAGSHPATTFSHSGPWKRLPAVTIRIPLDEGEIEICSPFGGIVYIVCEGADHMTIDLNFYEVGRHPLYSRGNPALWQETHNFDAPWGEIETQAGLIQFLHHFALHSFLPGSLPANAREALASLAAYSVVMGVWPEQEPEIRGFVPSPSPLYAQFLKIYIASDKKLFPMALGATRPRVSETGGKGQITYGFFVKKLTQVCGSTLTQALLDDAATATRPDDGYELGASENLEEYHLNPWEMDRRN